MKLKDKVAVITGSASGMGKAITKLYAKEGAKVVATDIDFESLQKVVDEIKADGGEALEDVENMIEKAVSTYGTLDILVNNAGVLDDFRTAEDVSDELWKSVFAINVDGPMMAIRKALPIFLEKESGVIINNSSIGGLRGSRAGIAYTASKHAVNGITKNVGFQYAQKGIRCNAIAPGGVKTSIGNSIKNPSQFGSERAQAGINLNPRYGESEEIAKVALFLASDDSSFVNGEILVADGGWTAY